MKNRYLVCSLIAGLLVVSACSPKVEASVAPMDMSVDTVEVILSTPEVDECLACHTDKQRLIDTAKPEEVKVKESKGVG
jgi:hypothetical protein